MANLRIVLVVCGAVLAIPTYWVADKLIQTYATSIAKDRILTRVQDEEYLANIFHLQRPFLYANFLVFYGTSLEENELAIYINTTTRLPKKRFHIYFEYTNGVGEKLYYEYMSERCGERYCHYDKDSLIPSDINPAQVKAGASEVKKLDIVEVILGYAVLENYSMSVEENGTISHLSVYVANQGLNPLDRLMRRLSASHPPYYWWGRWRYEMDYVIGNEIVGGW
jgi:hypothetical protein